MPVRKKSPIPKFTAPEEEAVFWDTHSLEDFEDDLTVVARVQIASPLRHRLSIEVDATLLTELAALAGRKGVGLSTLVRAWLWERIEQERGVEAQP